jgi:hypothetical protein
MLLTAIFDLQVKGRESTASIFEPFSNDYVQKKQMLTQSADESYYLFSYTVIIFWLLAFQ